MYIFECIFLIIKYICLNNSTMIQTVFLSFLIGYCMIRLSFVSMLIMLPAQVAYSVTV